VTGLDVATGFDSLRKRANALGLAVRGAFRPEPGEFDAPLSAVSVGTIVLLGITGSAQWELFMRSAEAADGIPHPLDRWSRRMIGYLAREFDAIDVYPNGASPQLPFQRLAARSEPVHKSPIGLLIHTQWGLWHAYRGALILPYRIQLPALAPSVHPCAGCMAKPCLISCPVHAFESGSFDIKACVDHVSSTAGSDCRDFGCRARRACPVGAEYRYVADHARFHMEAFISAHSSTDPPSPA